MSSHNRVSNHAAYKCHVVWRRLLVAGPTCNWLCGQLINLTKRWKFTAISYKSCAHLEGNKNLSRNFLRIMPSFQEKGYFFTEMVRYFNWEHVTIVTATESSAEWSELGDMLEVRVWDLLKHVLFCMMHKDIQTTLTYYDNLKFACVLYSELCVQCREPLCLCVCV